MAELSALERALHPRAVAVYGASEDVSKFGGASMQALRQQHYAGRLIPVTPKQSEVMGWPTRPHLAGTGETVDLVLIAVPKAQVPDCLRDAAAAGARCAVVITAGYADAGTESAAQSERELVALAHSLGVRLVGPNCNGLMVGRDHLYLGPNMLARQVPGLQPGPLCLISQSGSVMGTFMAQAHALGLGTGLCVSLGNQADLDACDFLEYALSQDDLKIIALYLEEVTDPPRLRALCQEAKRQGKPVIALKAGRTAAGVQAAMSHTGAMVGAYDVFLSACEIDGVVVCESLRELVVGAWALTHFAPLEKSSVGVVSPSGGAAGLLADRLSEAGFDSPILDLATWNQAAATLPEKFRHFPADLGVLTQHLPNFGVETMAHFFSEVLADESIGALVLQCTTVLGANRLAQAAAQTQTHQRPFLVVDLSDGLNADMQKVLQETGIPGLKSEEDLLYALRTLRRTALLRMNAAPVPAQRGAPVWHLPESPTEDELKQWLAGFGVPVVPEKVVRSADEAVQAADQLGYPVVLKLRLRHVMHKTERAGVALHLRHAQAVREAYQDMHDRLSSEAGEEGFACLVQAMVQEPLTELMAGARQEAGYGTFVAVGAGGVLVELLDDHLLLPAPASPDQMLGALQDLRVSRLLCGYRGQAGVDLKSVAQTLADVSQAMAALGDRLLEMDVNPIIITAKGPVVVDAAARLRPSTDRERTP